MLALLHLIVTSSSPANPIRGSEPTKKKVRIVFGKIEGAWGKLVGENGIKIDMKGIIAESKRDHFGYKFDLLSPAYYSDILWDLLYTLAHGKSCRSKTQFRIT